MRWHIILRVQITIPVLLVLRISPLIAALLPASSGLRSALCSAGCHIPCPPSWPRPRTSWAAASTEASIDGMAEYNHEPANSGWYYSPNYVGERNSLKQCQRVGSSARCDLRRLVLTKTKPWQLSPTGGCHASHRTSHSPAHSHLTEPAQGHCCSMRSQGALSAA